MNKTKSLDEVYAALDEIRLDSSSPRNVKQKMDDIRQLLSGDDLSIGLNKALSELEYLSSDVNLDSFTRTQLLHLVSLLENSSR